jgi:hypothetical protein
MKTDQQFWEDVATAIVPIVVKEAFTNEGLIKHLAQQKLTGSGFAAQIAAATADELLRMRNVRIEASIGAAQERAVGESAATS